MKKILTSLFLCLAVLASAQQQAALDNLLKLNAKVKNFEGAFTRDVYLKATGNTTKSAGMLYFQGTKLSMIYSNPKGEVLVLDGTKFTQAKPDGKVQTPNIDKLEMFHNLHYTLLYSMAGKVQEVAKENEGNIAGFKDDGKYYTFTIKKDKKRGVIAELVLVYDKKDGTLYSMKMIDRSGGYSLYTFTGAKKINGTIDAAKFAAPKKGRERNKE